MRPTRTPLLKRVSGLIGLAAATTALLWPAVENGYLLVNVDTARHLAMWSKSPFFPQGYNLWLYPWYAWNLPWAVAGAQAALVAGMTWLALRLLEADKPVAAASGVVAFLAAATYAPIQVSTALPDAFTPIGLLSLALAPLPERSASRWALAGVAFLSATVHYSHAPIFLATLATSAALHRMLSGSPWRRSAPAAGALTLAIVMLTSANWFFFGRFQYSPAGSVFVLARLQEDGPATEYLRKHCPNPGLRLCSVVERLPMSHNDFLWANDAPVRQLGGFLALSDEAALVVRGALWEHPGKAVAHAVGNAYRQLGSWTVFPSSNDVPDPWFWEIASLYPRIETALLQARQFDDLLDKPWLGAVQRGVILISALLLLPLAFMARRTGAHSAAAFTLALGVAQLYNALVMAGLSGVEIRYQVRVIWLLPLAAAILALVLFQRRRDEG